MKWEVTWTWGGYTIVEAATAEQAEFVFDDKFDLVKHALEHDTDVDIVSVSELTPDKIAQYIDNDV